MFLSHVYIGGYYFTLLHAYLPVWGVRLLIDMISFSLSASFSFWIVFWYLPLFFGLAGLAGGSSFTGSFGISKGATACLFTSSVLLSITSENKLLSSRLMFLVSSSCLSFQPYMFFKVNCVSVALFLFSIPSFRSRPSSMSLVLFQ